MHGQLFQCHWLNHFLSTHHAVSILTVESLIDEQFRNSYLFKAERRNSMNQKIDTTEYAIMAYRLLAIARISFNL